MFEIAALCMALALVVCCQATMPLWIGASIKAGVLTTTQVGQVGSAELAAIAAGILIITLLGQRSHPRALATTMTLLVAVANFAAVTQAFIPLLLARALSGFCVGILSAIAGPMAACRPNGQRVLTLSTATGMMLVSAIYFGSPRLIERCGAAGLFTVIGAFALLATTAMWWGLPKAKAPSSSGTHAQSRRRLAPAIACLAYGIVTLGQGSVFLFIVTIGQGLGLNDAAVGRVLATALPLSVLATVAAHWVGERIGLLKPLMIALLLLAADIVLLAQARTLAPFYLCVVGLNLFFIFSGIYANALVGQLDPSGRFVNALSFLGIGVAAIGPALGSQLIVSSGFRTLTLSGACGVLFGLLLFLLVGVLAPAKPSFLPPAEVS